MVDLYINASHSPFSPGGVWGERTEYGDVLIFSEKLAGVLSECENIRCRLFDGRLKKGFSEKDIVLSFHRDSNMKNSDSYGAKVLVQRDSNADIQYKAFRLLDALCVDGGFRFRGVHTFSESCPLKSIETTGSPLTFVFYLGFIDNVRDNKVLDCFSDVLIKEFAKKLTEIIKETENEVSTAFSEAALRGKQFENYKN